MQIKIIFAQVLEGIIKNIFLFIDNICSNMGKGKDIAR